MCHAERAAASCPGDYHDELRNLDCDQDPAERPTDCRRIGEAARCGQSHPPQCEGRTHRAGDM